jgi:Secretion system C-terminal sorting domain
VRTLKTFGGFLYIGGDFALVNGLANTRLIAKYDGTTFTAVGGGIVAGNNVRTIQPMSGTIYVGGDFTKAGSVSVKNIAAISATTPFWVNYGSGVTSPVNTLFFHASNRYMGQEVAGTASNYLKVWSTTVADENIASKSIKVEMFPNPTTDVLTIQSPEKIKSIAVYALSGVLQTTINDIDSDNYTLSLTNLPSAAYIVQLTTVEGKNAVQKLIKY